MKKIIKQATFIFSVFVSGLAYSGTPYMSGQIGEYFIYANAVEYELKNGLTGRLAGGYQWNTWSRAKLGIEAGINGFEDLRYHEMIRVYNNYASINTVHFPYAISKYSVDTLVVLDFYLTKKVDLFLKLGAAFVWEQLEAGFYGIEIENNTHAVVPKIGLGVGYDINKKLNFNIVADKQVPKEGLYGVNPASTFMLGFRYKFKAEVGAEPK